MVRRNRRAADRRRRDQARSEWRRPLFRLQQQWRNLVVETRRHGPSFRRPAAPGDALARYKVAGRGRIVQRAIRRRRAAGRSGHRSEEHTSELQSLMRISYAVFCLKKKNTKKDDKPTID